MKTIFTTVAAALLLLTACTEKPEAPKSLVLYPGQIELYPGSHIDITVKEHPDDFDLLRARWSSSNTDVATVDSDGRVTAVAEGLATITLAYRESRASMEVKVIAAPITLETISLTPQTSYIAPGGEQQLALAVTPQSYVPKDQPQWSSSDPAVALVSQDGKVTAKSAGTTEISVSLDGKTAKAVVHVYTRTTRKQFTLFQLNVWEDLTDLKGGATTTREAFYDIICELKPDLATFCELNSADAILGEACKRLNSAGSKQYSYTKLYASGGRGMLTSFPVIEGASAVEAVKGGTNDWFYRMVVEVYGMPLALYASHSYYANYACYWPRGYDGVTWTKMDAPITDVDRILEEELKSGRQYIADDFIADCERQAALGRLCVIGGDFNQPSHLDWTEATSNLYEHNGCVVPWPISKRLYAAGVKDAFRELWPDPLVNYGITWPVANPDAQKDTQWAHESDDRDRIDYVYYREDSRIRPVSIKLVGPKQSIAFSETVTDVSNDDYIVVPTAKWPSDHRGLLVTFEIEVPEVIE